MHFDDVVNELLICSIVKVDYNLTTNNHFNRTH